MWSPLRTLRLPSKHLRLLRYPILGGERRAGDKGASKYDVMTDAAGRDGVGNISKGFLKKTARPAKSERTLRKALRDKRDALRAQGKPPFVRLEPRRAEGCDLD